jgi:hypothetical protein
MTTNHATSKPKITKVSELTEAIMADRNRVKEATGGSEDLTSKFDVESTRSWC